MKFSKKIFLAGIVFVILGCGGGSKSTKISGSVEASYLKNISVCVKNTNLCALTDSSGKFTLNVKPPDELEVKIGQYGLGSVKAEGENIKITPASFCDGNVSVAGYLGVFLHYASGAGIDAYVCDMKKIENIEINASGDTIAQKLKNYLSTSDELKATVNGKEIKITLKEMEYYVTNNPLKSGRLNVVYQGASKEGEFARFEFDFGKKRVKYNIDSIIKKEKLVNIYENIFFTGKNSSEFYFITSGVMVAKIVNSQKDFDIIAIPKNYKKLNVSDVAKKYNVFVKSFNIDGNAYNAFVVLTLNSDQTYAMSVKPLTEDNVFNITGEWELKDNGVGLYKDGNKFMNLNVKAGYYKNILVAEGVDGGFGFGSEAKKISINDLKSYRYLNIYPVDKKKTKICFGYTSEKMLDENTVEIKETDLKCFIARSYPNKKVITFELIPVGEPRIYKEKINPAISVNGKNLTLSGIAVGYDSEGFSKITILDADNGIYLNIGVKREIEASIGSNRTIE